MNTNELVQALKEASDAYYNSQPIMSDTKFDELIEKLRKLDPNHPFLKEVGARVKIGAWPKVKHKVVMGSQDKVKTKDEFLKWAIGKGDLVLTDKVDGSTIVLTYKDGQLTGAATRGDGFEGEEILPNALKIPNINHIIEGFSGILRGEVVLYKTWFKRYFEPLGYKNPRNAANGIIRDKSGSELLDHISVVCFDIIGASEIITETEKAAFAKKHNISYVFQTEPMSAVKIWDEFETRIAERSAIAYEIDGVVIKENDLVKQESRGYLNNRPRGQIAIKPEAQSNETKVLDIQWQVGLSGRISPVCIVEPTYIGGVTIQRVTLNNLDYIKKVGASIGATVVVTRQNDVIPAITATITPGTGNINEPTNCPTCNGQLERDGAYLFCPVISCSGKTYGDLMVWLRATKIRGVGPTVLSNLIELGITDAAKLVSADVATFNEACNSDLNGQKIYQQINDNLDMDLATLLCGLNVPHLGEVNAKRLAKHFMTFDAIISAEPEAIAEVQGIKTTAADIVNSLIEKKAVIAELKKHITIKSTNTGGPLAGSSFCITGELSKPREEVQEMIRQAGGEVKTGVSKDLNYLIMSDPTSTTSKAEKARKYGTKCISETDLAGMINGTTKN